MADVDPKLESRVSGSASGDDAESPPPLDLRAVDPAVDIRDSSVVCDEAAKVGSGPQAPCSDQLTRRSMFGLRFVDAPSLEPVVTDLLDRAATPEPEMERTVLTPNVDIMVQLNADRSGDGVDWDMFRRSQYCLPDGQPLVAVSHLLGKPLRARTAFASPQ